MAAHVLTEIREHIFIITLDRDEARNAINRQMTQELHQAFEFFENDPQLWVAILTHKGSCFCAGADLKEIAADLAQGKTSPADPWGFAALTHHVLSKPVIGALEGKALGGGTEIALALDIVVASQSAVFGLPEVARGLMAAGGGGITNMVRQVPFKVALELIFTGLPISSTRAYELGLINRVVPDGKALDQALEIAGQICANAPLAVRLSKAIAYEAMDAPAHYAQRTAQDIARHYKAINDTSADAQEGACAFAEKRRPVWRNR